MKDLFGDKVRFALSGPRRSLWQRFGASVLAEVAMSIEERALWARYGL